MKRKSKQIILFSACAMLFLCAAAPGFSRVFWRRRAVTLSDRLGGDSTWESLLQSDVSINGGHGRLEILGSAGSLDIAMLKLRGAPGIEFIEFEMNKSMSRATARIADGILRVIGLRIEDKAVLFAVAQSPENFARSMEPPPGLAEREAPFYPDSIVKSFIRVEATGAQLEISAASAGAGSIHDFFDSAFALNGWSRMIPPGETGTGYEGVRIFQKGSNICCVLVRQSGEESLITVLHKRLEMK